MLRQSENMDVQRIRELKAKLTLDLSEPGAAAQPGSVQRAGPIYISSPSAAAGELIATFLL